MKNSIKLLTETLIIILIPTLIFSQDNNLGLRAGVNLSKYKSSINSVSSKEKIGFYAGMFYLIDINNSIKFQPELLFSLQRSTIDTLVEITDSQGNLLPNSQPYDFEYDVNEFIISIPLIFKIYPVDKFYLESGPILGLIIDKSFTSDNVLLDGTFPESIDENFNSTFDFGIGLGLGYEISPHSNLNFRSNIGITERDDNSKSLVHNLGLEYKFN